MLEKEPLGFTRFFGRCSRSRYQIFASQWISSFCRNTVFRQKLRIGSICCFLLSLLVLPSRSSQVSKSLICAISSFSISAIPFSVQKS
ncbi:MAG: hypothetical protein ENTB_05056 [Enterocloster aldenensis]